jgi:hypothetical protein
VKLAVGSISVVLALLLSGCGGFGPAKAGESIGSCAYVVKVGGVNYIGTGGYADTSKPGPIVGDELGAGEVVRCDQVENDSEAGKTATAYRLIGVDPMWAVAFGEHPDHAMILVIPQGHIPDDVTKKIKGIN